MLLEGRVAIVSGVGPGLGQAVAVGCAREGAHVALAARTESNLKDVAREVEALGRQAVCVPTDVTDPDQCQRLVDATLAELGRVDVLVNNAFTSFPYGKFEDADLAAWRTPFEVNVFGALQLTQRVVPAMKAQGGGSVVMVNSMAARKVRPTMGAYSASKAALLVAAQVLALELGPYRIRVNSIVPGWMWGPNVESYVAYQAKKRGVPEQDVIDELSADIPLGFVPPQEDAAHAVLFLASDQAASITGQTLDVNGGEVFA